MKSSSWFFGAISHLEADRLLGRRETQKGTFLIRKSGTQLGIINLL